MGVNDGTALGRSEVGPGDGSKEAVGRSEVDGAGDGAGVGTSLGSMVMEDVG